MIRTSREFIELVARFSSKEQQAKRLLLKDSSNHM